MPETASRCKSDHTPFLMFYTSDWIAATNAFGFEERGFYSSVLFAMWERKGGLPDDPRWLGNCLNCDPRTARRLRDFLVRERKLESRDGFLVNRRMMLEISRYLRRKLPHPVAATQPELERVENNYGSISDGSSVEDRPEVGQDLFQFANEINDRPPYIPEAIFQKSEEEEKEDSQPASTVEQDPGGRAGASPEIVILKVVTEWTADETRARTWITTHVGMYGLDVVRDGVAAVVAEIAAGKRVAQPLQLASCVIRRLDAKRPAPSEREPGTVPPWVADKSIRGKRASDVLAEFYRDKAARMAAGTLEVAA